MAVLGRFGQLCHELPRTVQGIEFIAAPDAVIINEDLGHRALARGFNQPLSLFRIGRNVNILKRDFELLKEALCAVAIAAPGRRINGNVVHQSRSVSYLQIGIVILLQ